MLEKKDNLKEVGRKRNTRPCSCCRGGLHDGQQFLKFMQVRAHKNYRETLTKNKNERWNVWQQSFSNVSGERERRRANEIKTMKSTTVKEKERNKKENDGKKRIISTTATIIIINQSSFTMMMIMAIESWDAEWIKTHERKNSTYN